MNTRRSIRRAGAAGLVLASSLYAGDADTWAFNTKVDPFAPSPIDLRSLNEKVAGEKGFVHLSPDGNDLVLGDGTPVRFWGVACQVGKDDELALHARFLARLGVNLVRIGGSSAGLNPQEEGTKITDVNEKFLDDCWRVVAAMKKEGIYTRITPMWSAEMGNIPKSWGIEGYEGKDATALGLLFFEPKLQEGYKAWMKRLLTEKNPYTGIPLKDDPAVAILQIHSEDTLLHWTADSIHGGPLRELQKQFGTWAAGKYGSIDKALAAWAGTNVEGDTPAEGRLGLYKMHILTQAGAGTAGNPQRVRDQVEFIGKLERDFYTSMRKCLKEELGAQQLISGSNFWTADPAKLGDLERWAASAGDIVEINSFYPTEHQGEQSAWRIQAGDFYVPRSATRDPDLPTNKKHVIGRPFEISSTNWVPPHDHAAEGPIMVAAYGASTGLDGIFWNGAQAATYAENPYMSWWTIKGSSPMIKWNISVPAFLQQFPAAALIYRKGLVDPAQTVVHEERTLNDLLDRKAPLLTEELTYKNADPRSYFVGRVEATYDGDPARSHVADLSPYLSGDTIRNTTGQLVLNTKAGLLQINAPQAQGVIGFLKDAGGSFQLADLTIQTANNYATILAVALDGKALNTSGQILLQVGTQANPTGWETKPATRAIGGKQVDGLEIVSTGKMPWRVTNTHATIHLKNARITEAVQLDESGRESAKLPLKQEEQGVQTLTLPENAMYILFR